MLTQVVLRHCNSETVYWLESEARDGEYFEVGDRVILAEEGVTTEWTVQQVLGEYSDQVKASGAKMRLGTILEHIREATTFA